MERRTASRDFGGASSVTKALSVLEYVGGASGRTFADIAATTKLPKSTLLRMLAQLVDLGFLRRLQHGRYGVTLKVWSMGCNAIDYSAVRETVIPQLREIVAASGETAHYAVYENGWSVYVEKVEGSHPIRAYSAVGGRSPAYASATGKALLAHRSEEEIRTIGARATKLAEATLVGADAVWEEMQRIRRRGYAINRGEWRTGVWGVAAPVFDRTRDVIAAVGISGPRDRVEPNIEAFAQVVTRVARVLSCEHGAVAS